MFETQLAGVHGRGSCQSLGWFFGTFELRRLAYWERLHTDRGNDNPALRAGRIETKSRTRPERLSDQQGVLMPLAVAEDRESHGPFGLECRAVEQLAVRICLGLHPHADARRAAGGKVNRGSLDPWIDAGRYERQTLR